MYAIAPLKQSVRGWMDERPSPSRCTSTGRRPKLGGRSQSRLAAHHRLGSFSSHFFNDDSDHDGQIETPTMNEQNKATTTTTTTTTRAAVVASELPLIRSTCCLLDNKHCTFNQNKNNRDTADDCRNSRQSPHIRQVSGMSSQSTQTVDTIHSDILPLPSLLPSTFTTAVTTKKKSISTLPLQPQQRQEQQQRRVRFADYKTTTIDPYHSTKIQQVCVRWGLVRRFLQRARSCCVFRGNNSGRLRRGQDPPTAAAVDPADIWWSPHEIRAMKSHNSHVGPLEHAHLVQSLKVFQQLFAVLGGSSPASVAPAPPTHDFLDHSSSSSFSKSTSSSTLALPVLTENKEENEDHSDSDLEDYTRSLATAQKLLLLKSNECGENNDDEKNQDEKQQDDDSDYYEKEHENHQEYIACRGLDNWGNVSGRTNTYLRGIVEYSKTLRQEQASTSEKDIVAQQLRQKSREWTRPSRQWAYALAHNDAIVATTTT